MIIRNLIVGHDRYGHNLLCGDICKYKIDNEIYYVGMVIYSEEDFAFVFEQLDDKFPVILMNKVKIETIEKIIGCEYLNDEFANREKWIEMFNNNLYAMKLSFIW